MAAADAVAERTAEDNIMLREEYHDLTPKQRQVVVLLFYGYRQREIAAMLGLRQSSVAMRLFRARQRRHLRDKT